MQTKSKTRITPRALMTWAASVFLMSLAAPRATPAGPLVDMATESTVSGAAAEQEYFLSTAKIVDSEPLPGVEGTARVTLSQGGKIEHALVRTIEAYEYRWATIRDSYRYNVAAYRLGKLLGLAAVPVTVERELDGRMASLTLWPNAGNTPDKGADIAAFRQLVYKPVDSRSNLPASISAADYSQAFGLCDHLPNERNLAPLSSDFLNRLQTLDRHELGRQLGSLLSKNEIEFLWERRHELLEHSRQAVAHVPAESSDPHRELSSSIANDLGLK